MVDLSQYANVFGKGIMVKMMPTMVGSTLLGYLEKGGFNRSVLKNYVNNDVSLFENITEDNRKVIKNMAQRAGSLDWLTVEWALKTMSRKYPLEASSIAGWPQATTWLEKQKQELINIIQS